MKQNNELNNIENMNFKNINSFYKFLINTKGEIKTEQYNKAYQKLKGKLSSNKNNIDFKNYCETNIFFQKGLTKSYNKNESQKYQNIVKVFKKDFGIENEYIINSFWVFWKHNILKNKWNATKKYMELFIKGMDNKAKLSLLFKPFLKGNINIHKDFISEIYNETTQYKTIAKKHNVMMDINQKEYLQQLQQKLTIRI